MNKNEFKTYANREYDSYEQKGITVRQTARDVEDRIKKAEARVGLLESLRNDISTHMGKPSARFDRKLHTHDCGNGCPRYAA